MGTTRLLRRHASKILPLAIILVASYYIWELGSLTLENPLLSRHCMKNVKTIEVSYNMVRYRDPLSVYCDWLITPENPRGRKGSIFGYETPLSALVLAGVYAVTDSSKFEVRLELGRQLALLHLLLAYVVVAWFLLRESLFALAAFSFFLVFSHFTISYSAKPQAETFAIFYQALFLVGVTHLARWRGGPLAKSLAVCVLTGLLCAGGKMNYFLVAAPVVLLFPLFDEHFRARREFLRYYAVFLAGGLLALGGLLLLADFALGRTLVFMIRGNKEIVGGSLLATFLSGLDSFTDVWDRTEEHFGKVVFLGGVFGTLYLAPRAVLARLFGRSGRRRLLFGVQPFLLAFLLGHALNYVVLCNLYVPHHYYVVPLYMLCCLALAAMAADLGAVAWPRPRLARRAASLATRLLRKIAPRSRPPFGSRREALAVVAFGLSALAVACFTGYAGRALATGEEVAERYAETIKFLGSSELTLSIRDRAVDFGAALAAFERPLYALGLAVLLAGGAALLLSHKVGAARRCLAALVWARRATGLTARGCALVLVTMCLAGYAFIGNGRLFTDDEDYEDRLAKSAEQLGAIRAITQPGALVICPKWCAAFYADKRSITEPDLTDIDYYTKRRVHHLGPPDRELAPFFERLRDFPLPETYWRLKRPEVIEQLKKRLTSERPRGKNRGQDE